MKLTARSQYALLALTYLARNYSPRFIPVEVIAEAQGIPPKYLGQILFALKRGRYLFSSKGSHGGYRLAKNPANITFAEIIRFFDGALAPVDSASEYFYVATPIEKEKRLIRVFKAIRDYTAKKLEATTLADAR